MQCRLRDIAHLVVRGKWLLVVVVLVIRVLVQLSLMGEVLKAKEVFEWHLEPYLLVCMGKCALISQLALPFEEEFAPNGLEVFQFFRFIACVVVEIPQILVLVSNFLCVLHYCQNGKCDNCSCHTSSTVLSSGCP